MPASFIQIPIDLIRYVSERKLSGLQYRLWLHLFALDPFGDRYVPIPSPEEIALELGVCARSISRAAQRLIDLDLFDFNVNSWSAKNTIINKSGKKSPRTKRSNFGQKDPGCTNETKKSDSRQKDPTDKPGATNNRHSEPSHTVSDLKQTLSYESEGQENKANIEDIEPIADYWLEDEVDCTTLVKSEDLKEGSNSARVELIRNKKSDVDENITAEIVYLNSDSDVVVNSIASKNPFNWLPPGPWNVGGKLDPQFRDWLAIEWKNRYGGTIHQKRADVLSHFRKDPANLAIRWEQYSDEYLDRYQNTQMRLANGLAIGQEEQKQLIENHGALTKPLPETLSPVAANKQTTTNRLVAVSTKERSSRIDDRTKLVKELPSNTTNLENNFPSNENKVHAVLRDTLIQKNWLGNNKFTIDWQQLKEEEKPDNPVAYRNWQPEEIERPADPSQIQEFLRSFRLRSSMPTVKQQVEPNNELKKLNAWLKDDILYPEAVKRAKAAGYEIEYSCEGVAMLILESEF